MPSVARITGFQVGYAREVKQKVGITTMAVGLITEAKHAEAILREGQADLIALARELMDNPNWPLQAARALGCDDPFDLVHAREAQRLRLREHIVANTDRGWRSKFHSARRKKYPIRGRRSRPQSVAEDGLHGRRTTCSGPFSSWPSCTRQGTERCPRYNESPGRCRRFSRLNG